MEQALALPPGHSTEPPDPFDWSKTALGARSHWPHCLRLTVDIVLNCPLPMLLAWGSEPVVIFNDAYATLGGPRHARAPGAAVPALWPAPLAAGDAFERARRGEALVRHAQPLALMHGEHAEQIDADLYFTPVRDEQEQVRGVLCALAPGARRAASAGGTLRILVVEDNLDAQYLVCEMLNAFGHTSDGVARAEAALVLLANAHYDVLFSDVSLPGMSGVELARRALAAQPGLKIIFASGYGEALLRHVDFPFVSLQKPYELEQLQAALASVSTGPGSARDLPQTCG